MMGDDAASIIGPSYWTVLPPDSCVITLWLDESERTRLGMLLMVPSAEYVRLRVLCVSEEAFSSVAMSVGDAIPSRESMMELMTAGLAGFAFTRLGERRFDEVLSRYSGPGCELDRRVWSHC